MKRLTSEEFYAMDGNLKRTDVEIVREWLDKQPHLPRITDVKILYFLHSCYYKIEPTKNCIENFYTIRAHCPEIFSNRDVTSPLIRQQMRIVLIAKLPGRTRENYSVMLTRLMDRNPDRYDYAAQIKVLDMAASMALARHGPGDGQVLMMDSEGFGFGHLTKANLAIARKHLHFVQEGLPIRLKAIHVVNVSQAAEKLINLMKPFIKKELFELIHLHRTSEALANWFDCDMLPEEYGGNAGSFKVMHEAMLRDMMEAKDYFLEEDEMTTDESRRVGKPMTMADIFGIEGTFKKLDID